MTFHKRNTDEYTGNLRKGKRGNWIEGRKEIAVWCNFDVLVPTTDSRWLHILQASVGRSEPRVTDVMLCPTEAKMSVEKRKCRNNNLNGIQARDVTIT